ncbi:MAG: cobalamin-dependent protein [bacterium]|nr:cobalamin-dependent protein [bacterium]
MIRKSAWIAMPMGLLYLAAILEKNAHSVKIIDMEATGLINSDMKIIIEKENPLFVGITATTPVIKKALELCRIVKEINKEIKTLLIGPHPTHLPMETINEEAVDIVVSGEGEITIYAS